VFFSTVLKSAENSAFFEYLYSNFANVMFLGHISTFLKLTNSQVTAQNIEKLM
jgi:hypothetical protein